MDTKKQILAALNVYDVKDVDAEFTKYEIKDMLVCLLYTSRCV